ncbi:GNAT family N-acetyltransferase [Xylanimonas protaetiae]|uniref:GNAT family N-acetyltransferase n=1 Tax=Xylanimonas protaetiae TaxID=2509457 RepID=A0A4P6F521_9MICO|nr:GNAT family N-acetyltransferase [Xylanimonas protaetiae]QAY71040.1 GNAT family N-acetyltransferase [Xylanimonas protaetiae]
MPDRLASVGEDSPVRPDVVVLLAEHLADMYATSPAESVHALDPAALAGPGITFVTARDATGTLLGCGALTTLGPGHGELKSMRTAAGARGRGVATAVLEHLLALAAQRGCARVSLETGTEDYFAAARRLYARHGFVECPPFGAYVLDPHSVFLTREVRPPG